MRPASPPSAPARSGRIASEFFKKSSMKSTRASIGKKSTTLVKTPPRPSNRRFRNMQNGVEKVKKDLIVIESDSDDFEPSRVEGTDAIDLDRDDDEEMDLTGFVPEKNSDDVARSDGPPPFRLEILCNEGETVMQMMQRVGEDFLMEKIVAAQNDGRTIIGGEALGISCAPPPSSQARIERLRNSVHKPGKRKNSYDAEKALAGEFSFGYRGKGKTYPTRGRGKRKGSWRGRGRGKGRGRR